MPSPSPDAAHVWDFREIADWIVEHDDICTAANALRNAQDQIDEFHDIVGVLADQHASEELKREAGRRYIARHGKPVQK